ncbi:hypothetical protein NL108_018619 [Boleophthalmus pectinirostris]|nr:hypothetical protein NL108_018619 [Boleophthalmus pectinirostris]
MELHYKTSSSSITKVSGGKVLDSRLTLNPDCSLSVQNVTKEHTGLFLCRQKGRTDLDTNVYLNVLTVSPAPPEPESQSLILQCTLWRYSGRTCSAGTLVWLDQNQKVLSEKQKNCESNLTVELQSPQICPVCEIMT